MAPDTRTVFGQATFRLMPNDDFSTGPTEARITELSLGAFSISYSWAHPQDGKQYGQLLIGAPHEESKIVTVGWVDTWHQKPHLQVFTGTAETDSIKLEANYIADWRWQIELIGLSTDSPTMTFRNVVPESALQQQPPSDTPIGAGPYDVSVFSWRS
ncbi:hypothetical protein [Micrococcoides hystricis]|uniref:Uncharacterized protein n=1 Tax=Micrococcoides hystricis TaxID=1572761 RepID=A0ABV6PCB0_9MICC